LALLLFQPPFSIFFRLFSMHTFTLWESKYKRKLIVLFFKVGSWLEFSERFNFNPLVIWNYLTLGINLESRLLTRWIRSLELITTSWSFGHRDFMVKCCLGRFGNPQRMWLDGTQRVFPGSHGRLWESFSVLG